MFKKDDLKVGVRLAASLAFAEVGVLGLFPASALTTDKHVSPIALVACEDDQTIFIASSGANQVLRVDTRSREVVSTIPLSGPPSGLSLDVEGKRLFVTFGSPRSSVAVVNVKGSDLRNIIIPAGHTTVAPVFNLRSKMLLFCNRFDDDVSVINLTTLKELRRIPVRREPIAADITKNGKYLLVANHLQSGPANMERVAAVISVVDIELGKVVKEVSLPNGSGVLNDVRVSPDGEYAAVTHLVASFNRAASRVQLGWMNANALTVIDTDQMEVIGTILLDQPNSGAANPWGLAWSSDGSSLLVTQAGTQEVSIIDFPQLVASLQSIRTPRTGGDPQPSRTPSPLTYISRYEGMEPALPFLTGARRRVKLPIGDLGPRAILVVNHTAYVANYFSDTLTAIDLSDFAVQSIPLGPKQELTRIRKGELYFNDASLCRESWQSCASCHPGDARADGLNWDLLNDGIGNPKNTKSLLFAHQTPPSMWLGVRDTAETAVRAGLTHILFSNQPEEVASAIDSYLKSLKPVPSPYLIDGKLSPAAQRGKKAFTRAGCAGCHIGDLFTDNKPHDVGTRAPYDKPLDRFITPTLVEIWRTAPYLHDGSAANIREILTSRNLHDEHGTISILWDHEVEDLCTYVLSL